MATLIVHNRAARYIERMDARLKKQVLGKLQLLANNPTTMPGVKAMVGEWTGFHRLRHGDIRIIFRHDRANETVMVAHVGPRGDAYK